MNKIDTKKVKNFWEKRAQQHKIDTKLTNLEENDDLQILKLKLEGEKLKKYFGNLEDKRVLDLGGGWGYWGMVFGEKSKEWVVVDYCKKLIVGGEKIIKEEEIKNMKFICQDVTKIKFENPFDIIFISGLLIYLDNVEFLRLLKNLKDCSKPGTIIILRDSTGTKEEFVIDNKYSESLEDFYSAIYRTRLTYISNFEQFGFKRMEDEDMFKTPKLNKYTETRLRIYKFVR